MWDLLAVSQFRAVGAYEDPWISLDACLSSEQCNSPSEHAEGDVVGWLRRLEKARGGSRAPNDASEASCSHLVLRRRVRIQLATIICSHAARAKRRLASAASFHSCCFLLLPQQSLGVASSFPPAFLHRNPLTSVECAGATLETTGLGFVEA